MDQAWFEEVWETMPAKVKESPDMMTKTLSSLQVELR
jgi:hypothetical protein